jgi:hypothetical protein
MARAVRYENITPPERPNFDVYPTVPDEPAPPSVGEALGPVYADPIPTPSGGNGGGGGGSAFQPYGGPLRPIYDLPPIPQFTFTAPTPEQAALEPGYAFARDEGLRAAQQSAAGRGVLRTGGTLKDLITWGNRFASQNYGDVYDRRFREAEATYGPMLQDWQARASAQQRAAELEFSRAWEAYKYGQDWNQERELALAGLI